MSKITIHEKLDRLIEDFDQHANEDHHKLLKRIARIEHENILLGVLTSVLIILARLL